jgi:hypothetical protein
MIAAAGGSDVEAGADRFADTQPGRIREVQHEDVAPPVSDVNMQACF